MRERRERGGGRRGGGGGGGGGGLERPTVARYLVTGLSLCLNLHGQVTHLVTWTAWSPRPQSAGCNQSPTTLPIPQGSMGTHQALLITDNTGLLNMAPHRNI